MIVRLNHHLYLTIPIGRHFTGGILTPGVTTVAYTGHIRCDPRLPQVWSRGQIEPPDCGTVAAGSESGVGGQYGEDGGANHHCAASGLRIEARTTGAQMRVPRRDLHAAPSTARSPRQACRASRPDGGVGRLEVDWER